MSETPTTAEQVAAHSLRNRELIELIREQGGDLHAARTIDLHFWAPDEGSAVALAEALGGLGVTDVQSSPIEDGSVWNVEAQLSASVEHVVSEPFVEQLVTLATSHDSEFDGWGTSL